ncbi:hypothetical protein [Tessaracoccus sp. G1721]
MSATTQERPGWGPEAAHKSFGGDTHSLRDNGPVRLAPAVDAQLSRYAVRMLEDAITEAMPWHWTRRAEGLDNARPRPGDFHGQATREDLADRYARLTEQAEACREHAELLRRYPPPIGEDLAALVVAIIGGDPR